MNSPWMLVAAAALYLIALGVVSELVERRPTWATFARRPVVVGLALGVYATTWSVYGSVGFAAAHGYGFLAIHLGVVLSCLAIPVLWQPLAALVRRHRLASVADLLAFRYQSQRVGVVVTTFLVLALLPYISLQLRAIVETGAALDRPNDPPSSEQGLVYAVMLSTFAVVLGARWADARQRGAGLLATLAVESCVKLIVLVVAGGVALIDVFGDFSGLDRWLEAHPESLTQMVQPVREDSWIALTFGAFVAAFLLPRQFHVAFVVAGEGEEQPALRQTTWVLPLFLLGLNLPLPILFWAGQATPGLVARPDLWVVEIAARHGLGLVIFLGGVSAASAMVLVASIALSGMVVNHVVLPLVGERWLLQSLGTVRRLVIVALVLAGFALHLVLPAARLLVDLGLVSFAAVAQLFPGVLGALFWGRATHHGMLVGLGLGVSVWVAITVMPLLGASVAPLTIALMGQATPSTADAFGPALWLSLFVNGCAFGLVSLSESQRPAEVEAASACRRWGEAGLGGPFVDVEVLRERLAAVLGETKADVEVAGALSHLGLDSAERGALASREIARVIEASLAERLGPLAAGVLVGRSADEPRTLAALATELDLRARERDRASWASSSGLHALELIRSYLAQVLAELPLGVCAVEPDGGIVVWNGALARLSGVTADRAVGSWLHHLPAPWGQLLAELQAGGCETQREHTLPSDSGPRTLRFRGTALAEGQAGAVLMVEDLTERRAMLAELGHRDRLSSIGRLAAGVAHEVLNPLTGILMVSRNILRELDRKSVRVDADFGDRLSMIVSEGQRIERIVRTLLLFARAETPQQGEDSHVLMGVRGLVDEALRLARLARVRGSALRFEQRIACGVQVYGERQGLVQVLVNLLTNAIDASRAGSTITIGAREENDNTIIEVIDDGVGIAPALAPRVFEPFFTTKEPGEGTGLGLATSYRIISEQGGSITWSSGGHDDRQGTRFRVTLPRLERVP